MAFTSENVEIAGRTIRVANGTYGGGSTGKTQTINVCDRSNQLGNYEQVYRIRGAASFVTSRDIVQHARSLVELDTYLTGLGFVKEGGRKAKP